MSNLFQEDFRDFILALNQNQVEYLLIGGYSVIIYGYPRTTGDLDIWVNNTEENRVKLIAACSSFGLPTNDFTKENFSNPDVEVFSFGRPPVCIELIVRIKGLDFSQINKNATTVHPDGFPIRTTCFADLVVMKTKANRPKDVDDLNNIRPPE